MALTARKFLLILATTLLGLSGCANMPPEAQQYDSFSEYAEAVFRHQNDLISRLMMLNDMDSLPENDTLEDAEQTMNDACHLLNEYAERESDGDIIGPFFKRKVQNSIESCDQSIRNLEAMLGNINKH